MLFKYFYFYFCKYLRVLADICRY